MCEEEYDKFDRKKDMQLFDCICFEREKLLLFRKSIMRMIEECSK